MVLLLLHSSLYYIQVYHVIRLSCKYQYQGISKLCFTVIARNFCNDGTIMICPKIFIQSLLGRIKVVHKPLIPICE